MQYNAIITWKYPLQTVVRVYPPEPCLEYLIVFTAPISRARPSPVEVVWVWRLCVQSLKLMEEASGLRMCRVVEPALFSPCHWAFPRLHPSVALSPCQFNSGEAWQRSGGLAAARAAIPVPQTGCYISASQTY